MAERGDVGDIGLVEIVPDFYRPMSRWSQFGVRDMVSWKSYQNSTSECHLFSKIIDHGESDDLATIRWPSKPLGPSHRR